MRLSEVFILFAAMAVTACEQRNPVVEEQFASDDAEVITADDSFGASRGTVAVYVSGEVHRLNDVLDAYRDETGQQYEVLDSESETRPDLLRRPHSLPQTDLYIGDTLAEIWAIAETDQLRPTYSDLIAANVRPALRDAESRWIALSSRARIVAYDSQRVADEEIVSLQNYAGLANEMWRNRLCVSSSRLGANRSLIAFMVKRHGVREAESLVRRWRANFGDSVYSGDVALLEAIAAGDCTLGIVDSSAIADFQETSAEPAIAAHWFDDSGDLLIDIRGAGVSRHARNPQAAAELLVWLSGKDANALFAIKAGEFPANPLAQTVPSRKDRFAFVQAPNALSDIGFYQEDAVKLIERARYP